MVWFFENESLHRNHSRSIKNQILIIFFRGKVLDRKYNGWMANYEVRSTNGEGWSTNCEIRRKKCASNRHCKGIFSLIQVLRISIIPAPIYWLFAEAYRNRLTNCFIVLTTDDGYKNTHLYLSHGPPITNVNPKLLGKALWFDYYPYLKPYAMEMRNRDGILVLEQTFFLLWCHHAGIGDVEEWWLD